MELQHTAQEHFRLALVVSYMCACLYLLRSEGRILSVTAIALALLLPYAIAFWRGRLGPEPLGLGVAAGLALISAGISFTLFVGALLFGLGQSLLPNLILFVSSSYLAIATLMAFLAMPSPRPIAKFVWSFVIFIIAARLIPVGIHLIN
jgi:hypothetical protein